MENIGEVALYVKGKMSTTYAVVGLDYGDRACEGCQGQAGISLQRWNLLGVVTFLAIEQRKGKQFFSRKLAVRVIWPYLKMRGEDRISGHSPTVSWTPTTTWPFKHPRETSRESCVIFAGKLWQRWWSMQCD